MNEKNNSVGMWVSKILFYVMVAGVLGWTASLTLDLVSTILPDNAMQSYLALLLFDGGALIWLLVFMFMAKGPAQRAISALLMVFDLVGVGVMSVADIFMGGQTLTAVPAGLGTVVLWGLGLSTFINAASFYAFHITDPGNAVNMRLRALNDSILETAISEAETRVEQRARAAGDILAERMVSGTMAGFNLPIDIGLKSGAVKPVIQEYKAPEFTSGAPAGLPVQYAAESDVTINGTQDDTDFLPLPSKPARSRKPKA